MYHTILAPLDGSKRAEAILPHLEELALRHEAKVIFLQVIEPVLSFAGSGMTYMKQMEKEISEDIKQRLKNIEEMKKQREDELETSRVQEIIAQEEESFYRTHPEYKLYQNYVGQERWLTKEDFEEMAREGVRTVGEIGLGSVKNPEDAAPMVKWAKEAGMTVMMHTGGTSIPGSSIVTADMVIRTDPDIVSHLNGGPTAVPMDEVKKLIYETQFALEIVHCGNPMVVVEAGKMITDEPPMPAGSPSLT